LLVLVGITFPVVPGRNYGGRVARPVDIADVVHHAQRYGSLASLLTVTADARPHVGTVLVAEHEGRLTVRVGSRTRENIVSNPAVSLAWLRDGLDDQLIVDGTAEVADAPDDDGQYVVAITVERGILHRLAGRSEAGPSCRPLTLG
jgi:hypothetical protein